MKEVVRAETDYWQNHYNDEAGPLKVMLRRALNFCLAPGQSVLDFDQFTIDSLHSAGLEKTAPVYDIGCGGELRFLKLMAGSGHEGPLMGFEPNTRQTGVDTWEPDAPDPRLEEIMHYGDTAGIDAFFERFRTYTPRVAQLGRITLVETIANYLPVPSKSSGATVSQFAAYAIPKDKQPSAFREMARTVAEYGIHGVSLSHYGNKAGIREEEGEIRNKLEEITGEPVERPTPINAGLTTEGGTELMMDIWPVVYLYEHSATICINTPLRALAYQAAHNTTSDLYVIGRHDAKRKPTNDEYAEAYDSVVGEKIRKIGINDSGTGGAITDNLKQGLILGSNRELDLPSEIFKPIKGM